MTRPRSPAELCCDRLCRPQRIGILGHRGVGKTTLLTMLYREAAGGRLPGLRLSAADARTATYLADKIGQLESGESLPATLAETELRFNLYHQGARLELVVLDYQGEHIELGRQEPIRDFLRECDALWLCLAAPVTGDNAARLRAEQEVEQVVEDYLATERAGEPHRPMALIVTKADLLGDAGDVAVLRSLVDQMLSMTRHTLETHCPWQGAFAISSLGPAGHSDKGSPMPVELHPTGLEPPLEWLVQSLQQQDQARLEQLWKIAPADLRLLDRATRTYVRRYPEHSSAKSFRQRLGKARRQRWIKQGLAAVATCALFVLAAWGYDLQGSQQLKARLLDADDAPVKREIWENYRTWYPTRYLFRSEEIAYEREQIAELDLQIREQQRDQQLADLRRRAEDPDADPETTWADFLVFRERYPEYELDGEGEKLRQRIKQAGDARRAERARREQLARDEKGRVALRELDSAEPKTDLSQLITLASRLAKEHAASSSKEELLRRHETYLQRLDERDYEQARDYSTKNPTNFYTRRQRYQQYLDQHPQGAFASQARVALISIRTEWDKHDFREIRDLYIKTPENIDQLRKLSRAYLSAHAEGKYRNNATELLRWCDKVSEPGEYTVTLKSGSFSKNVAFWLSRGPCLSVMLEVNGVKYGPSSIQNRTYYPEWDYEFPRYIKWKLGDPVRIIVTDNYYWKRNIGDITFDADALAIRKLSGEVELRQGTVVFSSDFTMPKLPKVD